MSKLTAGTYEKYNAKYSTLTLTVGEYALTVTPEKGGMATSFTKSGEEYLWPVSYTHLGITAHGYVCDVTNEDAVNAMVKQITEEVGHINILVNNAGIIKRIRKCLQICFLK